MESELEPDDHPAIASRGKNLGVCPLAKVFWVDLILDYFRTVILCPGYHPVVFGERGYFHSSPSSPLAPMRYLMS